MSLNCPDCIVNDFFAFEQSLRNGVYVSVGDVNGDGYGDLDLLTAKFTPPSCKTAPWMTILSTFRAAKRGRAAAIGDTNVAP